MPRFHTAGFALVALCGIVAFSAWSADEASRTVASARNAPPLKPYAPTAYPGALAAGRASNVKFTVLVAGGAPKSRPEVSLQIRGLGRNVTMRDDGRGPDLSAGDRIYTAVVRFDSEKAKAGRCYDARATARSGTGRRRTAGTTRWRRSWPRT